MRAWSILAGREASTGLTLAVALVTILGSGASRARADMILSEVIVDLQSPGEKRRDIAVWNSGDETLYIEIKVAQIIDPERPVPRRTDLDDPRTAGLLATPNRLAVAPDERKQVRIVVRRAATERDLVYRVSFIPRSSTPESLQKTRRPRRSGLGRRWPRPEREFQESSSFDSPPSFAPLQEAD